MNQAEIFHQSKQVMALKEQGMKINDIAAKLGLSRHQVNRRINGALKRERLDPEIARRLEAKGITDFAGLHSGWDLQKDGNGSGQSLYFYLGPDQEKISFKDAILDALEGEEIPRLDPVSMVRKAPDTKDTANWVMLADLHVGGDYDDPILETEFNQAIDDLVVRMPDATHAVLCELGDLLEANDHKGITPASGNMLEVVKANHLQHTQKAIRLLRRAIYRLLETHETVEAHFIIGNHDPSAYIAVMLALEEHFTLNPRVNIVTSDAEFRVIQWGKTAIFPNHGHQIKWPVLKDVWADQFPDQWAEAKAYRLIATAHFHHDRKVDLVGATAEHFRTLHRPNKWAKDKGLFSRGSLTAIHVHKEFGEIGRTVSNITNHLFGY